MGDRYAAIGAEAGFEPGSRGRVLRNLMGIRRVHEMQFRESAALVDATQRAIDETAVDQRFTAKEICALHRSWLGRIYPWAGEYRTVNLSKDGFQFAAARLVPKLMADMERGPLASYTPCRFGDRETQATALAIVHAELVLIHPFREGNGRCARLVAVLMALQSGLPVLDFSGVRGKEKRRYIGAIHSAVARDYGPMTALFERIIARTLEAQGPTA